MTIYVVQAPSGVFMEQTIGLNRRECVALLYDALSLADVRWGDRYWKRWDAARRDSLRRGYKIVKVRLVRA